MKFHYKFFNLCGSVYKRGNLLFTPDGTSVVSPVGSRVTVLDLVNHVSRTLPFENSKDIACVALSPNGASLISIDIGALAMATLQALTPFPDGRALFVNFFKQVVLCEMHFKRPVRSAVFSPNGTFLAVTSSSQVHVWTLPPLMTQYRPFALHKRFTGHHGDVTCITWTRGSRFMLSGSKDTTVRLHSTHVLRGFCAVSFSGHRGAIVGVFLGLPPPSLNPPPVEDFPTVVYTVSYDGALFVWHWKDGGKGAGQVFGGRFDCVAKHYFLRDHAKVQSCTLHSSGGEKTVLGAGVELLVVGFDNGVFGLYEMPEFNEVHRLSISSRQINTVAASPSGEWLAFGCADLGQLLVWEWQSESYVLKQQGHFYGIGALDFSPDGRLVVTGGDDGKVKLWNSASGFCFVTFADHTAPVTQVCFASGGSVVFSASLDGTVRAYDLVRYRNFRTMTSPKPVQFISLTVEPSGEVVCAGAMEPFEVYVWSLKTGMLLDVLAGHEGPVSTLAFNPTQALLASGSWDGMLRLWDVFAGKGTIETLQHGGNLTAVAFRPDGRELCCAAADGKLYFWNPFDGKLKFSIDGREDIRGGRHRTDARTAASSTRALHFTSLCYSADGTCVLGGGNSKWVCIYYVKNKMLLRRFQVSRNRCLDGVVDMLNSKYVTDAGPGVEFSESEEEGVRSKPSLPGARSGEFSKRSTRAAVRTRCVRFSPTGQQWAAAATNGLLIFSLDESLAFDPVELGLEVTPENVKAKLTAHDYGGALLLALRLNEAVLLRRVLRAVPHAELKFVVQALPSLERYLSPLLRTLAEELESPHLHFYALWVNHVLSVHARFLQQHGHRFSAPLRSLQRILRHRSQDLAPICDSNHYTLEFLCSVNEEPVPALVACSEGKEEKKEEEPQEAEVAAEGEWMGDVEGNWSDSEEEKSKKKSKGKAEDVKEDEDEPSAVVTETPKTSKRKRRKSSSKKRTTSVRRSKRTKNKR